MPLQTIVSTIHLLSSVVVPICWNQAKAYTRTFSVECSKSLFCTCLIVSTSLLNDRSSMLRYYLNEGIINLS